MKGKTMKEIDVLVIGNGFDLWCKLKSKYIDYAKKRKLVYPQFYYELDLYLNDANSSLKRSGKLSLYFILQRIDAVVQQLDCNLNFWEIYFTIKNFDSSIDLLWRNIEEDILDFFKAEEKRISMSNRLFNNLTMEIIIDEEQDEKIEKDKFLEHTLDYGATFVPVFSLGCASRFGGAVPRICLVI